MLFKITRAAIHPGIHPRSVSIKVITIFPHPWSYTAKGGNKIHNITLRQLISSTFNHQTLNHQPSTINRQPSTINRQPSTINRQPSTINHQPSIINRQPSTINRQPSTVNHQPSIVNHQPSTINHQSSITSPSTCLSGRCKVYDNLLP